MATPYQIAAGMAGTREGQAALTDYLRTGGQNIDPVTRAWCADFVNATLTKAGQKGTDSGAARSFLKWGQAVSGTPQQGDVAVFSRGSDPAKGHVGFFDRINPDGTIRVLGGNQSDSVSFANYPSERLLGYRRMAGGAGNDTLMGGTAGSQPDPAIADFVKNNPQPGGYGPEVEGAVFGSMAPGGGGSDSLMGGTGGGIAGMSADEANAIGGLLGGDNRDKAWGHFAKAGAYLDSMVPEAPRISGGGGDARKTGNALLEALGGGTVADSLMKRRLGFLR